MKVEKVTPIEGVKVYIEDDNAIYMRTDHAGIPLWYEPDMDTLSLRMLLRADPKIKELEAAYQIYLDNYGGL